MSLIKKLLYFLNKCLQTKKSQNSQNQLQKIIYSSGTNKEPKRWKLSEEPVVYNTELGDIPFYSIWITLTSRERDIALLIRDDLSNNEIAQRLNISQSTVKTHVHNILTKFHISSRQALKDALFGLDLDRK